MGDQNEGFGSGILKGLKRVLFTGTDEPSGNPDPAPAASGPVSPLRSGEKAGNYPQTAPASSSRVSSLRSGDTAGNIPDSNMKLKVYQLLESMNQPGVDFFEVWNAAVEMGGANSAHIKAAFTSLRFADKSLTKQRLLDTGSGYLNGLQQVISKEAGHRAEEKARLQKEKEQVRASLATEIRQMEEQIIALQQKLKAKQGELDGVDANYEPRIQEIDQKINSGKVAVDEVMEEMRQVIKIIQTDIN